MLTVQLKTREGSKMESYGLFPGDMFTAYVFFKSKEKNKGEEGKGGKGGKSVPKEAGAGQERDCSTVQLREVSSASVSC